MTVTIWWIRRDLRLADNQALSAALANAGQIIPLFILDPTLLAATRQAEKRLAFLFAGLRRLDEDLRRRGSFLLVQRGSPLTVLTQLTKQVSITAIFAEADYSPYARRRDAEIAAYLPLTLTGGLTVLPPAAILKQNGTPYTVFTPFSRRWKDYPLPQPDDLLYAPTHLPPPIADLTGEALPTEPILPAAVPFPPGEAEAHRRLAAFTTGVNAPLVSYADTRNRVDEDGTSQLSAYLRFGMISAREAVAAANRQGAEIWLNELIWREFYQHILYHFPYVTRKSFRPAFDALAWNNNQTAFAAWCAGKTGYPIVDAAMRQLTQTGWMPNRARMITASFLVKDLLINWQWGERWFMQHLIDGDPAANNGGWQWIAGTGTDAAPYFRVFNPLLQSQKFDPDGTFIRRWLPELAQVSIKFIHAPSAMSPAGQQRTNCVIGQDYPAPIVDHAAARDRTLAAYYQLKPQGEINA